MSFNEFIQWLRNLFARNNQPEAVSPVDPAPAPPAETPAPPIDTPSDSSPGNSESDTTPTPPPLVEPTPTPPATIQLVAIDTESRKVPLNKDVNFQITTRPFGRYEDCSLDISGTTGATVIKNIDADGRFTLNFSNASKSDRDIQTIKVSNAASTVETQVTVSLMKLFWSNHAGRENICDDTLFTNQCAIRMGAALELSDIVIPVDRQIVRRCTTEYRAYKHHKQGKVNGHILAAQELANWIKSQTRTFGTRSIVYSKEEILGRSGIIFFRDGWGTTDHIDVWDGESLVGGFPSYFDSDFKELWFWDIY